MIYFTSDLHLGHEKAIGFTNRPFTDLDDMNNALIRNINDTVGKKDELWILGDFAYKVKRDEVRELRNRILCKNVHLIRGNHDKDYSKDEIFSSVQEYKELKTKYGRFILFHYPILRWNASHYGSVHLHGHIHSVGSYNELNLQTRYTDRYPDYALPDPEDLMLRIYDVGVDANGYKPISIEQIAALMKLEPIESIKDSE